MAAQCALEAADRAAARLGAAEVDGGLTAAEILGDPRTRESAAKWRTGSGPRQVTAALARLTTSLKRWVGSTSTPAIVNPGRGETSFWPGWA